MLSNSNIRLLDNSDYEQWFNLYSSHEIIYGRGNGHTSNHDFLELILNEYLNPAIQNKCIFGLFENDRLIMALGMYFWNEMPHCSLLHLVGLKNLTPPNELTQNIEKLYTYCLDFGEQRKIYRFYFIIQKSHLIGLKKAGIPTDQIGSKYLVCTEAVVPQNTKPEFLFVWNMMGRTTWPVTILVRSVTLLEKYRPLDLK